jgi:hypothetical protein
MIFEKLQILLGEKLKSSHNFITNIILNFLSQKIFLNIHLSHFRLIMKMFCQQTYKNFQVSDELIEKFSTFSLI